MNWLVKIKLRRPGGAGPPGSIALLILLLFAKMLKETETEKTIVFFVTFLSLVAFQLGRVGQAHWLCQCEGTRAPWNNIIVKGPFKLGTI